MYSSNYQEKDEKPLQTGRQKWSRLRVVLGLLVGLAFGYAFYSLSRRPTPLFGKAAEQAFLSIPSESRAVEASRYYGTKPHIAGSPQDLATAKEFLHLLQKEFGIHLPDKEPIFKAGSPQSRDAILSISRAQKPRAWIDTYYPILNTPLERHVHILDGSGNVEINLDLVEYPNDDSDADASKYNDDVPTFHGLSRSGDVTGPVVDGGYCTKEDFDSFIEKGVSFNGTIVLCRYGYNFRGLKVKGAQEVGASGVLIFSDVGDDGTVTEANGYAPYPKGPARNPTSVQRGSVQFISLYPGDPTTPGYPSYENSTRTEGENIPKIPSLPLSWENAQLLLRTLTSGDSLHGKRVRLVNNVNTTVTPIWNTLAIIPGHITDEVVAIGNHRDAWVLGATDPTSGTASVQELVRGLGHLLKKGWKPLRTILIASWDAEEYGLVGSTEWGEDFTEWINQHVVAYLNLDSSASGSRLRFSGSPLLAHLIRQTAEELPHPLDKTRSLWNATTDNGKLFGINSTISANARAMEEMELAQVGEVGVSPLGSGSDYTVFLQRIGVPSTNGGFGATVNDPVYHYHSVFDSERWQELYGDPGFHRHVAISQHLGVQALRIANSLVLPFNTTHYASELSGYLDRVENLAFPFSSEFSFSELRASIESLRQASLSLDSEKKKAEQDLKSIIKKWKGRKDRRKGRFQLRLKKFYCSIQMALGGDWKCHREWAVSGHHAGRVPGPTIARDQSHLAATSLEGDLKLSGGTEHRQRDDYNAYAVAVHAGFSGCYGVWSRGGKEAEEGSDKFPWDKLKKAAQRIQSVNKKLIAFERGFISKDGIKGREWFKHLGVAPGKWLGYGATTLPGLTEAITFERNATLVQYESDRLRELLDRLSDVISA